MPVGVPRELMQGEPAAAAVVIHYRTPGSLKRCLASLRSQAGIVEIVTVDNSASEDGPVALPVEPWWQLLPATTNLGFGRACNHGASVTAAPLLLFLNADVTLRDGAFGALRQSLLRTQSRALVGPRIWDARGEIELSARAFPDWRTALLGRTSPLSRALARRGRPPSELAAAHGGSRQVDWVSGACQLVRRDAFLSVGGFDERYWMYWEDADLCRRLSQRALEIWFEPAAEVDHQTGSSGSSRRTNLEFHRSAARFYERHLARGRIDAAIVRAGLRARAALRR